MSVTELDPEDFVERDRRLVIGPNVFIDSHSRCPGGLRRLFEHVASTIKGERNPILVPSRAVCEPEKYAGRRPPGLLRLHDGATALRSARVKPSG